MTAEKKRRDCHPPTATCPGVHLGPGSTATATALEGSVLAVCLLREVSVQGSGLGKDGGNWRNADHRCG